MHTWIAVKPAKAARFTVFQVVGWYPMFGKPALSVEEDLPDRHWYGNAPEIILDIRGTPAEAVLEKMRAAIAAYPHSNYRMWPGPNSNNLHGLCGPRAVPELGLVLPPTAIGKDFLLNYGFFAPVPSGTGHQISFFGLLGSALWPKRWV